MTDKLKKRILYPLFFIILAAVIVFNFYRYLTPAQQLKVRTYQVNTGWGYQISAKNKVIIDQPFIPVVPGKMAFPNKKTAAKAGRMVKQRMIKREHPALTREDLIEIGLDTSGKPAN